MAQDFERNTSNAVGTSAVTLRTANSDDAIVGITIANVTTSQITVEVYINDGSDTLVTVDTSEWPTFSEDLQDSLGFMNDINNDGLVDLIMHGITTEYNGNVEIYMANSNID